MRGFRREMGCGAERAGQQRAKVANISAVNGVKEESAVVWKAAAFEAHKVQVQP